MSDELAQLKDDLTKLLEAAKIYDARYKGADWKATLGIIESRIARLEAEAADPWRDAKAYFQRQKDREKNPRMLPLSDEAKKALAYVDHLTAERDQLAARVAELEAEPEFTPAVLKRADEVSGGDVILGGGMIRTVTSWARHSTEYRVQIMCDEWGSWFNPGDLIAVLLKPLVEAKPLGDMQPPFEGPIVGIEPVLDPARVLSTAAEVYSQKGMKSIASMCRFDAKDAEPYRLKGGSE